MNQVGSVRFQLLFTEPVLSLSPIFIELSRLPMLLLNMQCIIQCLCRTLKVLQRNYRKRSRKNKCGSSRASSYSDVCYSKIYSSSWIGTYVCTWHTPKGFLATLEIHFIAHPFHPQLSSPMSLHPIWVNLCWLYSWPEFNTCCCCFSWQQQVDPRRRTCADFQRAADHYQKDVEQEYFDVQTLG